jgi:hypothetical protein
MYILIFIIGVILLPTAYINGYSRGLSNEPLTVKHDTLQIIDDICIMAGEDDNALEFIYIMQLRYIPTYSSPVAVNIKKTYYDKYYITMVTFPNCSEGLWAEIDKIQKRLGNNDRQSLMKELKARFDKIQGSPQLFSSIERFLKSKVSFELPNQLVFDRTKYVLRLRIAVNKNEYIIYDADPYDKTPNNHPIVEFMKEVWSLLPIDMLPKN